MKSPAANSEYRILLADDHMVLRLGLRNLLSRADDLSVVGEAASGAELLKLLESTRCDLVILDLSMPGMNGIEVLDQLCESHADLRVLIFTMHKEQEFFRHAVRKGVHAYVLKDDRLELILRAIEEIRADRRYYSPELMASMATAADDEHGSGAGASSSRAAVESLTPREREILIMIASGATSKEIADDLAISHRTVQTHRANMLEKLELKNTAALIKFAVSSGLIE